MFEKKTINAVLFMQNKASEGPIFEANWAIHTKCETRQSKTLWDHKMEMEMHHSMFWSCRCYAVMFLAFTSSW